MEEGDGFSSGVTGLDFVPVGDGVFVAFPAEEDFAAFVESGEIEEGAGGVFEFDADAGEFFDEFFEAVGFAVEVGLERFLAGGREVGEAGAEFGVNFKAEGLGGLDISGDAFDEGEGALGFGEGEEFFLLAGPGGVGRNCGVRLGHTTPRFSATVLL